MPIKRRHRVSARHAVIAACTLSAIATTAVLAVGPPTYTYRILDEPAGVTAASPNSINNDGEVVGTCFNLNTGYFDGVKWGVDGTAVIVSAAFGLDTAEAIGIHSNGTILGSATDDANNEVQHGAVLQPGGSFTLLPSLAGNTGVVSAAFDMNDAGIVVGRSALVPTPFWMSVPNDAVIWKGGEVHSIGTLGGFLGTARQINNKTVVIGDSNTANSDMPRGFVWTAELGMVEVEPLEAGQVGQVRDINDDNIIVGFSMGSGSAIACYWDDLTGPPTPLPLLDGDLNSLAAGINDEGVIVGSVSTTTGDGARIWIDGVVQDLNNLLAEPGPLTLTSASRVTDSGLILAAAEHDVLGAVDVVLTLMTVPGDLDGDGVVDGADLAMLLGAWGACGDCDDCAADLDGNCTVDGADLAILLGNWD